MKVIGVIPARYASTRFPGKPLHLIAGKPLIQHVVEQCLRATTLDRVIVATDDTQIWELAQKFADVEMTRSDHPSGTDRIAEVAERYACDAIVNIQGDEPLIDPQVIDTVARALTRAEMSTAATRLRDPGEYDNVNIVKCVRNAVGDALYFSRRTLPYLRDSSEKPAADQMKLHPFLKHLGIYGYRKDTLMRLVRFPLSSLEQAEKLEQLRALENGIRIAVELVEYESIGVDVPADVLKVEALLRRGKGNQES